MIRRLFLMVMFVVAMVAALPVAASANPGDPNTDQNCSTDENGTYCSSGGRGQGGYGLHSDVEWVSGAQLGYSFSGGGGQGGTGGLGQTYYDGMTLLLSGGAGNGGAGGRFCVIFASGETQCETLHN